MEDQIVFNNHIDNSYCALYRGYFGQESSRKYKWLISNNHEKKHVTYQYPKNILFKRLCLIPPP